MIKYKEGLLPNEVVYCAFRGNMRRWENNGRDGRCYIFKCFSHRFHTKRTFGIGKMGDVALPSSTGTDFHTTIVMCTAACMYCK